MSSTSSTHPTITVEPLHPTQQQANLPNPSLPNPMLGAKGFLMKKMAGGQSFNSPTDMMVSPCTQKLVQSKKRHYTKGKPLSLSSSFQSSQTGSKLSQTPTTTENNQPMEL